jgi:hypothetical protein
LFVAGFARVVLEEVRAAVFFRAADVLVEALFLAAVFFRGEAFFADVFLRAAVFLLAAVFFLPEVFLAAVFFRAVLFFADVFLLAAAFLVAVFLRLVFFVAISWCPFAFAAPPAGAREREKAGTYNRQPGVSTRAPQAIVTVSFAAFSACGKV